MDREGDPQRAAGEPGEPPPGRSRQDERGKLHPTAQCDGPASRVAGGAGLFPAGRQSRARRRLEQRAGGLQAEPSSRGGAVQGGRGGGGARPPRPPGARAAKAAKPPPGGWGPPPPPPPPPPHTPPPPPPPPPPTP